MNNIVSILIRWKLMLIVISLRFVLEEGSLSVLV